MAFIRTILSAQLVRFIRQIVLSLMDYTLYLMHRSLESCLVVSYSVIRMYLGRSSGSH